MKFKVNIDGQTYWVEFRLAVVCKLLAQRKYGLVEVTNGTAVCNPADKFNLYEGCRLALGRTLDKVFYRKDVRRIVWHGFLRLFRPWVRMR